MISEQLSLPHLVRPPKNEMENPPLLNLLHGVGINEQDLFGLAPYFDERFLILSARAPNTLTRGSYAWFHVDFVAGKPQINSAEAEHSRKTILEFIGEARRAYNADARRVYLMGFSQGAIMSLYVMLTQPETLAGVVAMSGRVLPQAKAQAVPPERLKDFPVMVVHGLYDQVLSIEYGRNARDYLSTLPVKLDYREYPMAHQINDRSLADVTVWLSQCLDESPTE